MKRFPADKTQPNRVSARLRSFGATIALSAAMVLGPVYASFAQKIPIVRDAEIEALVREYARPILGAAGLANNGIEIVLVNDASFNAFVIGRRIFFNTGALMMAETPNEIIGVMAHEAGHIAGGHQDRLREQLKRAQTMAVVGMLLGIGATAAGAATNNSELAQSGGGIAMGTREAARRSLLGYQRTEETTADRSAITYLEATGQSAKGMLKTFGRFQSALSLSGARIDPYQVSHPLPRERIANMRTLAESSKYYDRADSPALQLRHDMMRAKIAVFTGGAGGLSRISRKIDPLALQYGQAMNAYLTSNPRSAASKAQGLVKAQPNNPYFQELLGDSLLKGNQPAQAAAAYSRAIKLDKGRSGILQISLGQALLNSGDPRSVEKSVSVLKAGLAADKENATGYQYLAQAYGKLGREGEAQLAIADQQFYLGKYKDARIFAARAQQTLKPGTPAWVRAQDIINFKQGRKKG